MKDLLFIAFVSIFFTGCIEKQNEFESILRLENRRVPCDSLVVYLDNQEPKIRARAVEAIGKLQDTSCQSDLIVMLGDLNHNVRQHAAFALGQLEDAGAELALIRALNQKEMTRVKVYLLEAIGKIGTAQSFPIMVDYLNSYEESLRAASARALGRMALRGLSDPQATDMLMTLLQDKSAEVRWKAAYALMRIGNDLDNKKLVPAFFDTDPRVRMYAIRALGQVKDPAALEPLGKIIQSDSDWRVRVNAANAFANYPLSLVANYLSLLNQGPHVRLAIMATIGKSIRLEPGGYRQNSREHNFAKHQLDQIIFPESEEKNISPVELAAALVSYAQMLGENAIDIVLEFKDHEDLRVQAKVMTALGETGSPTIAQIFEKEYDEAATIVKIAMLEALIKHKKISNAKLFLQALEENDSVISALAAKGLSQDTLKSRVYVPRIIQAYQNLENPVDPEISKMFLEAMGILGDRDALPVLKEALLIPDRMISLEAAKALEKITAKDYTDSTAAFTQPYYRFDYNHVLGLNGANVLVKTQQGDFQFSLLTEQAPLTCLNFVKLVEEGFYNNLTFHRVVPNFVIQTGDPRGDGWGSPGYAIRSEFNSHPYERGVVGMASAGKDTEGSQFFITHSPQPHLDGRYTVFGEVTDGMSVVNKIQEGDVMKTVSILR